MPWREDWPRSRSPRGTWRSKRFFFLSACGHATPEADKPPLFLAGAMPRRRKAQLRGEELSHRNMETHAPRFGKMYSPRCVGKGRWPMNAPDFYLASCDYRDFAEPQACYVVRHLWMDRETRHALLVRISPGVSQEEFPSSEQKPVIEYFILTQRFQGTSIYPIVSGWPLYVYILLPMYDTGREITILSKADYEMASWGELYRTEKDARKTVSRFSRGSRPRREWTILGLIRNAIEPRWWR